MKTQADFEEALEFMEGFLARQKQNMDPFMFSGMSCVIDTLRWGLELPHQEVDNPFPLENHIQRMREFKKMLQPKPN